MPRLAYMVTKQTMCLKQTQSLFYFATAEHWINIQVSSSVVKWYTSSHEKGFWNSLKQLFTGVKWKRCSEKYCKIHRKTSVPGTLFLIKLQAWVCNLFKKRLWYRCFSVNFARFLRTRFFTEQLWTTDCFWIAYSEPLFRRFSKVMAKIREEY